MTKGGALYYAVLHDAGLSSDATSVVLLFEVTRRLREDYAAAEADDVCITKGGGVEEAERALAESGYTVLVPWDRIEAVYGGAWRTLAALAE